MQFSKLNITNSVIYYTLDTIINIFEIFELTEIDSFVTGMKIRNLSKGKINGKAFKNALHIKLKENAITLDIKFFSNGKIQIPGSVNHSELLILLEKFFFNLKKLKSEQFCLINYSNSFYFNLDKTYIIGKYNGHTCNRIRILNNNGTNVYILIPEEIRLLKQDGYFYTDEHFRKRKIYNNLGEYIGVSQVVMKDRKNLPKNGSFYIKNKQLFYNYNSKMFGEIVEPEIQNKILNENEKLKTFIFYNENFKIDLNISNTNGSFKILCLPDSEIDKTKLFNLLSKKYTTIYNPNDYPAIKCIFYYNNISNSFTKKETSSSNTIKVQIYGDRVNLTGRTKKIVIAGYTFLSRLLLELNEIGFYKSVLKTQEIDDTFKECSIFDLYELI